MQSMRNPNIVLIGFMGSGKSTAAKLLHEKLDWPCVSTDHWIEEQQKETISQIFEAKGEAYFRELEHRAVKELAQKEGVIIDCGGGIVLNPENIKLLKQNGVLFYLNASVDVIYGRIKNQKHRPLIAGEDPWGAVNDLLNKRRTIYEHAADEIIDSNEDTMRRLVEEILKKMKERS